MATLSNLKFNGKNFKGAQGIQGNTGSTGTQGISNSSGIGPFESVTITSQHTLSLSNVGKLIKINAGVSSVGLNTITIPASTFDIGDVFLFFNESSPDQKISAGAGVSFFSAQDASKVGDNIIPRHGLCTVLCLMPNQFSFSGNFTLFAGNGLTPQTAGTSAYSIKLNYPSSVDGFYYIIGYGGNPVLVYCDMTTDGGGWMLIHQCNGTSTTGALATQVRTSVGTITGATPGTNTGTIPNTYKLADADINYFMNNKIVGKDRPNGHNLPIFRVQINSVTAGGGTIDYYTTNSTGSYTFTDGNIDFRGISVGSFSDRGWDTYAEISSNPTSPPYDNSYVSGTYTGWGYVLFYGYNVWGSQTIYNSNTNGFYSPATNWVATGSLWYR